MHWQWCFTTGEGCFSNDLPKWVNEQAVKWTTTIFDRKLNINAVVNTETTLFASSSCMG